VIPTDATPSGSGNTLRMSPGDNPTLSIFPLDPGTERFTSILEPLPLVVAVFLWWGVSHREATDSQSLLIDKSPQPPTFPPSSWYLFCGTTPRRPEPKLDHIIPKPHRFGPFPVNSFPGNRSTFHPPVIYPGKDFCVWNVPPPLNAPSDKAPQQLSIEEGLAHKAFSRGFSPEQVS